MLFCFNKFRVVQSFTSSFSVGGLILRTLFARPANCSCPPGWLRLQVSLIYIHISLYGHGLSCRHMEIYTHKCLCIDINSGGSAEIAMGTNVRPYRSNNHACIFNNYNQALIVQVSFLFLSGYSPECAPVRGFRTLGPTCLPAHVSYFLARKSLAQLTPKKLDFVYSYKQHKPKLLKMLD